MTARTFQSCANFTLASEGGFVDNPADPGGATNMGVTLRTLTAWREQEDLPAPTVDDVRDLSRDEATAIFAANFYNVVRGNDLPPGVDMSVSDFAFNAGPRRAAMLLQQAVGLHGSQVDGWIGPQTLALVTSAPLIIATLATQKALFYRSLPGFATFGHGWLNRVEDCRRASQALWLAYGVPPATTDNSADAMMAAEQTTLDNGAFK